VATSRITRMELFEPEDVAAALARFAELRPDPLRIPPNAATGASDRLLDAVVGRDWDALEATCAPSLVFEDRRRLMRTPGDRDQLSANTRGVGRGGPGGARTGLATAGERLALSRLRWSMELQRALQPLGIDVPARNGPDVEIEHLLVTEVDTEGRI